MNFIFIRMHSLLDYLTKLFYEIEHLAADFKVYPKLTSSKILFGDRKKLLANGALGTLFEECGLIDEIELYMDSRDGKIVEKFLLMPDQIEGHLPKYKNRKLWYSGEDKINLRLPALVLEFRSRLITTLGLAKARLHEVAEARASAPKGS
jgi:hypothetical protein